MFAMLEDYDVQETRRIARMEGIAEGKAEGKAEGIEEGKAEGIEEGKAEGIEEGKAEGIVNVLIGLNFPKETILAKLQEECGLSEEQALTWYNKFI